MIPDKETSIGVIVLYSLNIKPFLAQG